MVLNREKLKSKTGNCSLKHNQIVENLYKTYIMTQTTKKAKEKTVSFSKVTYETISKSEQDKQKFKTTEQSLLETKCQHDCFKQSHTAQPAQSAQTPQDMFFKLDFIDPIENYSGNYQNYVTKSLKSIHSLKPFMETEEYYHLLNSKKINLGNQVIQIKQTDNEYQLIQKKTLILDLDETLIHADVNNYFINHDKILSFKLENNTQKKYNRALSTSTIQVPIPIMLRPGVKKFLQLISEIYEIVVFTASKKDYADTVLNYLDPEGTLIKHRLYRDNCIPICGKIYVKDLRIINDRCLENIVIVDNSMYSFSNQLSNGILITSFFNDRNDIELLNLGNYLVNYLANVKDVRIENEKFFKFESMEKSLGMTMGQESDGDVLY